MYFGRVVFLGGSFSGPVFNAGITVVLACIAYVLAKAEKEKAKAKKNEVGIVLGNCVFSFEVNCKQKMVLLQRRSSGGYHLP